MVGTTSRLIKILVSWSCQESPVLLKSHLPSSCAKYKLIQHSSCYSRCLNNNFNDNKNTTPGGSNKDTFHVKLKKNCLFTFVRGAYNVLTGNCFPEFICSGQFSFCFAQLACKRSDATFMSCFPLPPRNVFKKQEQEKTSQALMTRSWSSTLTEPLQLYFRVVYKVLTVHDVSFLELFSSLISKEVGFSLVYWEFQK